MSLLVNIFSLDRMIIVFSKSEKGQEMINSNNILNKMLNREKKPKRIFLVLIKFRNLKEEILNIEINCYLNGIKVMIQVMDLCLQQLRKKVMRKRKIFQKKITMKHGKQSLSKRWRKETGEFSEKIIKSILEVEKHLIL